ncbi:putative ATP-dependent RNA helicase DDX46-like [Sarcoptes scabiei]|nr:putative ATP-dependent RNA helicase DDX46-like [Sarcoptes scabiei]
MFKEFALICGTIFSVLVSVNCDCKTVEELDQCAYEINFLANRNIQVPSDDDGAIKMCDKAKEGLKCLTDYAKECSKGPVRAVATKLSNDLEKHLHARCDDPGQRGELLKHIQCFKDQSKADAIRLCSDKHMVMMEKVSNLPKPLRVGGACCSSHSFHECVIGHITKLCSGETGDYFSDMVDDVAEENIDLICKEFTNLDRCDAKFDPAVWTELKGIMASEDPVNVDRHKYKTLVPIIMKMIKDP